MGKRYWVNSNVEEATPEYCPFCGDKLSYDAAGNSVATPMVPRVTLGFAVCCAQSGETCTMEDALAVAKEAPSDGEHSA